MAKVQNFSGITPDLPFTEYDFYDIYKRIFENSGKHPMKDVCYRRQIHHIFDSNINDQPL